MARKPLPTSHKPKPGAPLRWTARHHRLVELAVLGLTNNEIANKLGYSATRVSVLINHPDIIDAVEALRNATRERSLGSLQNDLATDARNTFDKLRSHRDDPDADVSLKACGLLWDRQIPKRVESKSENTIRFVIDSRDRAYLEQVAEEDDAPIEVEYRVEEPHGALPSH